MGANCSSVEKASCLKIEPAPLDATPKKRRSSGKPKKEEEDPKSDALSRSGSQASTRPPTDSSRDMSPKVAKTSGQTMKKTDLGQTMKKTDLIRHEKNLKRLRKVALEIVGQLNYFNVFLKRVFPSLNDAFSAMVKSEMADTIDVGAFSEALHAHGYSGDENNVFHGLCDDGSLGKSPTLSRQAFVKRMSSMGDPFFQLVRLVCIREHAKIKKKVVEVMRSKNRDLELVEDFRKLIASKFPTPGDCFDAIAGDDGNIDEEEFLEWLGGLEYSGDASKVFHNFCNADGYITRMAFTNILFSQVGDALSPNSADKVEIAQNSQKCDTGKKTTKLRRSNTKSICGTDSEPQTPASPTSKKKNRKLSAVENAAAADDAEQNASCPTTPTPKRKMKRRSTTNSTISTPVNNEAELKEPESAKKKGARRRSGSVPISLGEKPDDPTPVTARKNGSRRSSSVTSKTGGAD